MWSPAVAPAAVPVVAPAAVPGLAATTLHAAVPAALPAATSDAASPPAAPAAALAPSWRQETVRPRKRAAAVLRDSEAEIRMLLEAERAASQEVEEVTRASRQRRKR